MHNRARMITASFLTRDLGIDWRHGYQHFGALLADGDVACNAGNWQWVAGTGNNTRPNRVMNPLREAQRFDRAGRYVRRYVSELAGLDRRTSRRRGSWRPVTSTTPAPSWSCPDASRRPVRDERSFVPNGPRFPSSSAGRHPYEDGGISTVSMM